MMTLYRYTQSAQIGQILRDMQQQSSVFSLYALTDPTTLPDHLWEPEEDSALGIARIAELDFPAAAALYEMSAPLLAPPARVLGLAQMQGGVRVQCVLAGVWQQSDKLWSLHAAWPQGVWQLQRRRHPRMTVPLGQNYTASFNFGHRRCKVDIDDLSLSGVALRGTRAETSMLFLGKVVPKVQLRMADGSTVLATLKVRSRRSYRSFLLGEQVLVGCSVEAMEVEGQRLLEAQLSQGL